MAVKAADQITIVDVTDAYSVILTSEAYTFPGTTTAAKAGSTTTQVIAMQGANQVAASVTASEVSAPSGVTVAVDTDPTAPTLTITVATSVTAAGNVSIPVHIGSDITITKTFSFGIAFTGATGGPGGTGTAALSAIVGLSAVSIPTNNAGATIAATTLTVPFAGYQGTARVAATIAATNLPSGITAGTNTAATTSADGSLVLNVASGSTLGGSSSGVITLTVTAGGQTFTNVLTWSKAVQGAQGSPGAAGAAALTIAITSSNGFIFHNTAIATTFTAHVFQAGVELTGTALAAQGTINWYIGGSSTAAGTGSTYTIDAGDVNSESTIKATLEG